MLGKRTVWCALPVLLVGMLGAEAALRAAPPAPKPTCEDLVAKARKGAAGVDFTALRLTCGDDPAHHDSDPDLRTKLREALHQDDWPAVVEIGNRLLAGNFLDIDAHMFVAFAYEKQKQDDKAAPHRAMGDGLVRSILASGDGRTMETAFVVISVDEEYAVLKHYRLSPGEQSLLETNGHSYDMLTANQRGSEDKATLYFNIDKPMAKLHAHLSKHS